MISGQYFPTIYIIRPLSHCYLCDITAHKLTTIFSSELKQCPHVRSWDRALSWTMKDVHVSPPLSLSHFAYLAPVHSASKPSEIYQNVLYAILDIQEMHNLNK